MPAKYVSIYLNPELDEELMKRGAGDDDRVSHGKGTAGRKTLERYFALMHTTRRNLRRRGLFSDGELSLIADVLNGTSFDPIIFGGLEVEIEDALEDGLAQKWGVDGQELVKKLRGIAPAEELAIIDAVERWWKSVGDGNQMEVKDLLK